MSLTGEELFVGGEEAHLGPVLHVVAPSPDAVEGDEEAAGGAEGGGEGGGLQVGRHGGDRRKEEEEEDRVKAVQTRRNPQSNREERG